MQNQQVKRRLSKACLSCFKLHRKCDKTFPCEYCTIRGKVCKPNPSKKKRGRPVGSTKAKCEERRRLMGPVKKVKKKRGRKRKYPKQDTKVPETPCHQSDSSCCSSENQVCSKKPKKFNENPLKCCDSMVKNVVTPKTESIYTNTSDVVSNDEAFSLSFLNCAPSDVQPISCSSCKFPIFDNSSTLCGHCRATFNSTFPPKQPQKNKESTQVVSNMQVSPAFVPSRKHSWNLDLPLDHFSDFSGSFISIDQDDFSSDKASNFFSECAEFNFCVSQSDFTCYN